MKKLTMAVILGLFSLMLATGVGAAQEWKGKSETRAAGNVQVELIVPADGLVVGDNNIAAQIKDAASGQPVVRDSVKVDMLMDGSSSSMGHGGMGMSAQDPIVAELKAVKNAAGRYEGKVGLSATGDWKARVFADPRGLLAPATFALRVGSAGPNWLVLGGFAALILAGIGGVVALVKKSSSPGQATTVQETSKA